MDTENKDTKAGEQHAPAQGAARAMDNHTVLGVLSYLGPLVIISYLMGKQYPFVKFHIKQGLVLLCVQIILWVLLPMLFLPLWGIWRIVHLLLTILAIIGIVNVVQKKQKELPIVGEFSKYFKF